LVDPIPFAAEDDDHGHEEEANAEDEDHAHDSDHTEDPNHAHTHSHSGDDPHFWLDATRMGRAAHLIGEELTARTGTADYASCGAYLAHELQLLDAQVREILEPIPTENRKLVTDHAAWGYFTAAYDFEQVGVVIPGGSTEAEPSSADLARLVETIREIGVPAIFSNNAGTTRTIGSVAGDAGTTLVELYEGSLGPAGSGAETYQDMMLTNARLIADALG
ncbi:MAG: metal ABC transporter substrate-binding protein, partial [bacterium]|nr:metal ABC transporter substrate-binding protein [bacterium]